MGGGGGGRICLRYDNYSLKGTVSAFGGAGYFNAAAGSVLMLDTSGVSFLIFDNGGRTVNKVTTLPDPLLQCDTLIVRGNAILSHIPGDTNGLRIVATNVIIEQDGLIVPQTTLDTQPTGREVAHAKHPATCAAVAAMVAMAAIVDFIAAVWDKGATPTALPFSHANSEAAVAMELVVARNTYQCMG